MERLASHLRPVRLAAGTVLLEAGHPVHRCYFLESGIASLVLTSEEGSESSIGAVGREGMVGTVALLSESRPLHRAVMQLDGSGWMLGSEVLHREFKRGGRLQQMLLRHMHLLLSQSAQTAMCRCVHTVDRQICSWLLTTRYQTESDQFDLTHECIASTLGVRRAGITVAAHDLRSAGLIDYSRGHITILNHRGLEARACKCHAVIRRQLDALYATH
jgi:CRP-like cAMP-binding protein